MPCSLDSSTFSKVVVTPFTSKLFYFRNVIYATSNDWNRFDPAMSNKGRLAR
jgi:hypothetical protein